MENQDLIRFVLDNWQFVFLYSLKYLKQIATACIFYLKDISESLQSIKTQIAIHEVEIKNLKER